MSAEIQSVRIFIAYSSKDLTYKEEIRKRLKPLVRAGRVAIWDNYDIEAGADWDADIREKLEASDLILLLLSPDALDSDYFYEVEAPIALRRHKAGEALAVGVLLRPCALKHTPFEFAQYELLPKKGYPITDPHWANADAAYLTIFEEIDHLVEKFENLRAEQTRSHEGGEVVEKEARQKQREKAIVALSTKEAARPQQQRKPALKKREQAQRNAEKPLKDDKNDPFADLMVFIKGGDFDMGNTFNDNTSLWGLFNTTEKSHHVKIKGFYLCKYPVTQGQWETIMGDNPSHFKGDDKLPVEQVSWDDAKSFIKKLNKKTGKKYRLPTEAEWEYAAREGGKKVRFGNGKDIADPKEINFDGSKAWKKTYSILGEDRNRTTPVGSFTPNALGLYDMSGNVSEWCEDVWHSDYLDAPVDGSAWVLDGDDDSRVFRGGSCNDGPADCRSAFRGQEYFDSRFFGIGFRLAR